MIPSSKSSYNRALIIQSFNSAIQLQGESACDDVLKMKAAIKDLELGKTTFDCGEAGTVLRFLTFRIARKSGTFLLTGKPRLFKRPQQELVKILEQLKVKAEWSETGIKLESQGWVYDQKPIQVSAKDSSQFLSGLLLNSWDLPKPLSIEISKEKVSESYFMLTLHILKAFGLRYEQTGSHLIVPAHQKPKTQNYIVESDLSSAFAVAALAAVSGSARMKLFPFEALQPDLVFTQILLKMGVACFKEGTDLVIKKANHLKAVAIDLKESPDLFPVLSALASCAQGESHFFGAPHLRFKETDRIAEVITVLKNLQVPCEGLDDGAKISGVDGAFIQAHKTNKITLDAKDDHRLVMMGAVLNAIGFNVQVLNTHSVHKSFPEFLDIAKDYL